MSEGIPAGEGAAYAPDPVARLEIHRHGAALLPAPFDRKPGIAFWIAGQGKEASQRFCTCSASRRKTCSHLSELSGILKLRFGEEGTGSLFEEFRAGVWHRIADLLFEGCRETPEEVRLEVSGAGTLAEIVVRDRHGAEMLRFWPRGAEPLLFAERCGPPVDEPGAPHRGAVLRKLALLTMTENERFLLKAGHKSRRQALEESFWLRVAYHVFRELGPQAFLFQPAVEESSGLFTVTCRTPDGAPVCRLIVPRDLVPRLLAAFRELLPNQHHLAIHPVPLKSIFKVSVNTELDLEVRPMIQLLQEGGEARFLARDDLERFRYGRLVYVKELGLLAELERPERERLFKAPVSMTLKRSQIPGFLDEIREEMKAGSVVFDEETRGLRIFHKYDRIEIKPEALERDWCWLDIRYGFGAASVSLAEILEARADGQRFIGIAGGWVDCGGPDFDSSLIPLDRIFRSRREGSSPSLRLSRLEVLRLGALSGKEVTISGAPEQAAPLRKLLEVKACTPCPAGERLTSPLRPYQERGVEWLWSVADHGFGGLLCDDMGLGKTHQVMAFMCAWRACRPEKEPFLVVCPTTVLGHWEKKLRDQAPQLATAVYHGGRRDLEAALAGDVILTSYGILRRDWEQLREPMLGMAVFDEMQQLKNAATQAYEAAQALRARIKLGLTGTPIENRLTELKALMDLTTPGYLGPDAAFVERYQDSDSNDEGTRRGELRRLIAPFTLRRLKSTVLTELPEKIEDLRTCRLSEEQVALYREAIASRGAGLLQLLEQDREPIPYIHVFALLTLLKQICDHPSLVAGSPEEYGLHESGKWELFKELLAEALDSGQKVVVYSQFLGMIEIIGRYLAEQEIDAVTLTGKSRKRAELISRFNEDPDCRVFVGSLKAAGAGIDLVAGSVVIHYDRWWNAAKEDQATDRVHRIGQQRGVLVLKLVTEGTLEEKIAAIIDKKRELMASIVKEDDPGLLKTFSRAQLLDLLAYQGPAKK